MKAVFKIFSLKEEWVTISAEIDGLRTTLIAWDEGFETEEEALAYVEQSAQPPFFNQGKEVIILKVYES